MTGMTITEHSAMRDVLDAYPGAQRALFQRYHVGGCNSCGYQPGDTLGEVARRHDISDVEEVVAFITYAAQIDRGLQVSPRDVAAALGSGDPPRLIDVRTPAEWERARIEGATLMTEVVAELAMRWPKDAPIVFYCHLGQRSLDAASYFAGHGFTNVRSMTGGIDAWSLEVAPSVARYQLAPDVLGGATIRPLRAAVSEAPGCQRSEGTQ